jgi:putative nucleotidyltransferase with HDIG domain
MEKISKKGRALMASTQELRVDIEKIRRAIQAGLPYTITTFALPHDVEVYIEQVLTTFLTFIQRENFKDYLVYCIQELAVNAKKANTKRVYFTEKGLDIANPDDYKAGMASFKADTVANINHYISLQKERGLYIKLMLTTKKDSIQIEVRNNCLISSEELLRIQDKIDRAQEFNSMEDAFSQVLDDSEGAGLGIVVLVLMLKRMGLGKKNFNIMGTETETVAKIIVPLETAHLESLEELTAQIVESVESLPQFPESIMRVQKLINDPTSQMNDIARVISSDPAMTADILKLVNSAQYMIIKKCETIAEAVKLLGIKGVHNLLYTYGTQKLFGAEDAMKKKLWNHSYKTAFYAYNLYKSFGHDQSSLDEIYVGGVLHDMGKIVFSTVHPALNSKLSEFCREKQIPEIVFENINAGMNHAEIGALIAEKWNFPQALVDMIRYHHEPQEAVSHTELVDTVYIANLLALYDEGEATYEQMDAAILKNFGVVSKKQLDDLVKKLSANFKNERLAY